MFYIFELQHRPDGIVNVVPTEARSSLQMAKSYYHDRFSKMSATTLYTSVALYLCDENLIKIDHDIVDTMYVNLNPPVDEVTI